MIDRSYARVGRDRGHLVVSMVNPHGCQITILAERFFRLVSVPDEYALLVKMGTKPIPAWGQHGGDVLGCIEGVDKKNQRITLYYGSRTQRLKYDEDDEVVDSVAIHEFDFPQSEIKIFKQVIKLMLDQVREFDLLQLDADCSLDLPVA